MRFTLIRYNRAIVCIHFESNVDTGREIAHVLGAFRCFDGANGCQKFMPRISQGPAEFQPHNNAHIHGLTVEF